VEQVAFGEELALVGSTAALGTWDPKSAPVMTWNPGHVWTLQIPLPAGQEIEYKIIKRSHADVAWETCPNRTWIVAAAEGASGPLSEMEVKNHWKDPERTEVKHIYSEPGMLGGNCGGLIIPFFIMND
jgi:hypothetical protein